MFENSHFFLASAETGVFGVAIAAVFVLALAMKIGAAITRIFFWLIKVAIGLVVLSFIAGIIALFTIIAH